MNGNSSCYYGNIAQHHHNNTQYYDDFGDRAPYGAVCDDLVHCMFVSCVLPHDIYIMYCFHLYFELTQC